MKHHDALFRQLYERDAAKSSKPPIIPCRGMKYSDIYWNYALEEHPFGEEVELEQKGIEAALHPVNDQEEKATHQAQWLMKYNPNDLTWQHNHELLNWMQGIPHTLATVCIIDMDESERGHEHHFVDTNNNHKHSTDDRKTYSSFGAPFISDMISQVYMVFPESNPTPAPCIMAYPALRKCSGNSEHHILVMRAYGLFSGALSSSAEDFSMHLKRILMQFALLVSSCLVVCKNATNDKWMDKLDQLLFPIREAPLFGNIDDKRSIIVCTDSSSPMFCDFSDMEEGTQNRSALCEDLFSEIKECLDKGYSKEMAPSVDDLLFGEAPVARQQQDEALQPTLISKHLFVEYCLTWFGRTRTLRFTSSNTHSDSQLRRFSRELIAELQKVCLPLKFSFPLSRWNSLAPTGSLVADFILWTVRQTVRSQSFAPAGTQEPCIYKMLKHFGNRQLQGEVDRLVELYTRATREELQGHAPLEMRELVNFSETHAHNALKTFNINVQDALFPSTTVDQTISLLKCGINNNFRSLWIQNADNSAVLCEKIFESTFKWIEAEKECPSSSGLANFVPQFVKSLEVYTHLAQGTRKYTVLSFFSVQALTNFSTTFPEKREDCLALISLVENKSIAHTLAIDAERARLQKLSALRLKILSVGLSIERLQKEILVRRKEEEESAECIEQVTFRMQQLNVIPSRDHKGEGANNANLVREQLILNCEQALKMEKTEKRKYELELMEAVNNTKDTRMDMWTSKSFWSESASTLEKGKPLTFVKGVFKQIKRRKRRLGRQLER